LGVALNIINQAITLKLLLFIIVGITVYSLFIFKFYRLLSERDILKLKLNKRYGWHEGFWQRTLKTLAYLLEHIVMVPLLVFFWFAIMTVLIFLISKNGTEQIMLISMAFIASVRLAAYYDEKLSEELAKVIPFALLGVYIVDMNFISFGDLWERARQITGFYQEFIFYLIVVAALELIMRIIHLSHQLIWSPKKEKKGEIKEIAEEDLPV
jgi:hypothetical protein